jgi:hypothetical protein
MYPEHGPRGTTAGGVAGSAEGKKFLPPMNADKRRCAERVDPPVGHCRRPDGRAAHAIGVYRRSSAAEISCFAESERPNLIYPERGLRSVAAGGERESLSGDSENWSGGDIEIWSPLLRREWDGSVG